MALLLSMLVSMRAMRLMMMVVMMEVEDKLSPPYVANE